VERDSADRAVHIRSGRFGKACGRGKMDREGGNAWGVNRGERCVGWSGGVGVGDGSWFFIGG
jgi:hypothetical protein